MTRPLTLGAVAYDPKVVTIWDGFQRWFDAQNLAFDYVLYTGYEQLVAAQLAGHVDVAWNSPLAWLEAQAMAHRLGLAAHAVAMRDTDRDLTSVFVVRADSELTRLEDLDARRLGLGAADSPQATLIPLDTLLGLHVRPLDARRFDVLLGKHGDHVGGEREAVQALLRGEVDAAAILDANLLAFSRDGTAPPGALRVVGATAPYDHCNMTVVGEPTDPAVLERFVALLLAMDYADPTVRPLLDLEGLKRWLPGRVEGYLPLARACARFGTLEALFPPLRGAR